MWDEIVNNLSNFSSAVLNGIDANGYPFSMRCKPQLDEARQALLIDNAGGVPIQPGAAGLLCHSHNEQLWDLKAFLLLGALEATPGGWLFRPEKFLPGQGMGGFAGQMRQLRKSQAETKNYLEKRRLPRPKVRWDEIDELKAEIKRGK